MDADDEVRVCVAGVVVRARLEAGSEVAKIGRGGLTARAEMTLGSETIGNNGIPPSLPGPTLSYSRAYGDVEVGSTARERISRWQE